MIEVERTSDGTPLESLPQARYNNQKNLPLHPHGAGPFCRLELPRLSDAAGVYAIELRGNVVYVGECQNLHDRYGPTGYGVIHPRNCFSGGQSTNCKVNTRILIAVLANQRPILWFRAEDGAARKPLEQKLISVLIPSWNGRRTSRSGR